MKIAFIDLSTRIIGYAIFNDEEYYISDVIDLGKGKLGTEKCFKAYEQLKLFLGFDYINKVVVEQQPHLRNFQAGFALGQMHGILKTVVGESGIEYETMANNTWKELLTGYGRATKEAVSNYLEVYYGFKPQSRMRKKKAWGWHYLDETDAVGMAVAWFMENDVEAKF
ncbi:MAG TPA: hypothetical protein ENG35_00160 [Desulfobacteraceae bacterium]|nr:hypothetical protein [Desulfobacteraceae bacterium]